MLFDFLLQQAKVNALDTDTHEENTLEQVKAILSKAVGAYHSLCKVGKWHVNNKSCGHLIVVCWNFEKKGFSVDMSSQSKDQKKIATNKKKFSEQKHNSGGTNSGSKTTGSNDSQNYT